MPLLFPATPPLPLCRAARASRRATAALSSAARSSSSSSASFDAAAFEAERLRLDAAARAGMESAAAAAEADPRAWKWAIRKRVWDALEAEGVARDPRPVHHRIPNFDGAPAAADALGRLDIFQNSQCVKVNPDTPQKQVRFLTLSGDKKLLTPQPRLRTGFFSVMDSQMIPVGCIPEACTSVGAAKYGRPIGLDESLKVDLIVIGSVAVDPSSGARLGKGEGFAELEYGMLRYMGAIDDSTMIVTTGCHGLSQPTGNGNRCSGGFCCNACLVPCGHARRHPRAAANVISYYQSDEDLRLEEEGWKGGQLPP